LIKLKQLKKQKVIFETLNEGIVSRNTSPMVNEVKGSASKAMGISQSTKQPIVENDAFFKNAEIGRYY
jgi:sensor histidine kinase regulating citrate/malate metabolism